MRLSRFSMMFALIGVFLFACVSRGDLIHATSVSSTSSTGDYTSGYSVTYASDGVAGSMSCWVTNQSTNKMSDYFADSSTISPILVFDLGTTYSLTGFEFWNYYSPGNSVKTFTLEFSTDDVTWTTASIYTSAAPKIGNNVTDNIFEQDFTLSNAVVARYVRMTITDNWYGQKCQNGNTAGGGDRVGFSEIDFVGAAVPEPSAVILFGSGLIALLVFVWKKRLR